MKFIKAFALALTEVGQSLLLPSSRHKTLSALDISLRRALKVPADSCIKIEGSALIYYQRLDATLQSAEFEELDEALSVAPQESSLFAVFKREDLLFELEKEICALRIQRLLSKDAEVCNYLDICLTTANGLYRKAKSLRGVGLIKTAAYADRKVHAYKNRSCDPEHYSFHEALVLKTSHGTSRTNKLAFDTNHHPRRVFVFYLDNISHDTFHTLLADENRFPIFSKLKKESLQTRRVSSISNWTLPAGIAMASGMPFESHRIFHKSQTSPKIKSYLWSTNQNSEPRRLLKALYKKRFSSGNNWRMKQEHGLHSFFNHILSTGFHETSYKTLSNTLRQLDIAGKDNSLHWVSFMDSHHPLEGDVLPKGAAEYITKATIQNGYDYITGPKVAAKHSQSKEEIYLSQIKTIESHIKIILERSYEDIAEHEHAIILISDHGSSFMNHHSQEDSFLEKYSIMLSFKPHSIADQSFKDYIENISIHPKDLINIISKLCHPRITFDPSISNYSQILFPGKPYQFIFNSSNLLYVYTSHAKAPLKEQDPSALRKFMSGALKKGYWVTLQADRAKQVEVDNLPQSALEAFSNVAAEWIR